MKTVFCEESFYEMYRLNGVNRFFDLYFFVYSVQINCIEGSFYALNDCKVQVKCLPSQLLACTNKKKYQRKTSLVQAIFEKK